MPMFSPSNSCGCCGTDFPTWTVRHNNVSDKLHYYTFSYNKLFGITNTINIDYYYYSGSGNIVYYRPCQGQFIKGVANLLCEDTAYFSGFSEMVIEKFDYSLTGLYPNDWIKANRINSFIFSGGLVDAGGSQYLSTGNFAFSYTPNTTAYAYTYHYSGAPTTVFSGSLISSGTSDPIWVNPLNVFANIGAKVTSVGSGFDFVYDGTGYEILTPQHSTCLPYPHTYFKQTTDLVGAPISGRVYSNLAFRSFTYPLNHVLSGFASTGTIPRILQNPSIVPYWYNLLGKTVNFLEGQTEPDLGLFNIKFCDLHKYHTTLFNTTDIITLFIDTSTSGSPIYLKIQENPILSAYTIQKLFYDGSQYSEHSYNMRIMTNSGTKHIFDDWNVFDYYSSTGCSGSPATSASVYNPSLAFTSINQIVAASSDFCIH